MFGTHDNIELIPGELETYDRENWTIFEVYSGDKKTEYGIKNFHAGSSQNV